MKTVTEEQRKQLKAPLPEGAVTQHPTKTYLSSIKAIYVTERLNDVFGVGAWKTRVQKEHEAPGGMVIVKLTFEIPEYGIYHECFGGNDNGGEGNKNFDLGDAYKGATTDAMTKIGSYLEIGIDVFKGKSERRPNAPETKKDEPEKWLDVMDKEKNFTNDWLSVQKGIKAGEIKSVSDVRKIYKVSRAVAEKIEELLKSAA